MYVISESPKEDGPEDKTGMKNEFFTPDLE